MADVDDGPRDIGNDATAITFGATTVRIANDPSSRRDEAQAMKETCYGPHCEDPTALCMSFDTGGLTSILLVGFIWADVVNTLSLMFKCNKDPRWFIASIFVLVELLTAIVCGFLVGVYSETEFDAIGGAVGILFVHDLDEKVYASMEVFRETG
eukprot:1031815_1